LVGFDALACDPALTDAVAREGAGDALPALGHLAALVTSAEGREHARLAMRIRRSCAPTTATATASTRSSSTRHGIG
jgi:hypothetical protein